MVVRMMFGNHFSEGEQNRDQFQKAIMKFAELLGAYVPSDAIPWLRWFDLGGYDKKMKKTAKEIDVVINVWLEDHKKKMNSTSTQHVDDSRN
ncbi:putative cytochrome P450 superfamily [Helianthus debilis subsp. tardiflorus]